MIDEGHSFVDKMVQDEQKRRSMRGQMLFDQEILADAEVAKRLGDWMKERKHWRESKTLDPKGVVKGGTFEQAYIFYTELSMDAHPGLEALTRYLAREGDAELDFEPRINLDEVLDTLHLHDYAVLTVLVGVDQLLGHGANDLLVKLTADFQELERGLAELTSKPPYGPVTITVAIGKDLSGQRRALAMSTVPHSKLRYSLIVRVRALGATAGARSIA